MREKQPFTAPFAHIREHVLPVRLENNRQHYRDFWWRHVEPRPGMWEAFRSLKRYLVTPRVARHRTFSWVPTSTVPDSRIIAFAREDDLFFGILHSRAHELWSLGLGGWHGVGNDPQYTPTAGFETFPFPTQLSPNVPAEAYAGDPRAVAIAAAARRLNELRENWLNPADLVRREPEVVPGFPERVLPVDEAAEKVLKSGR